MHSKFCTVQIVATELMETTWCSRNVLKYLFTVELTWNILYSFHPNKSWTIWSEFVANSVTYKEHACLSAMPVTWRPTFKRCCTPLSVRKEATLTQKHKITLRKCRPRDGMPVTFGPKSSRDRFSLKVPTSTLRQRFGSWKRIWRHSQKILSSFKARLVAY